MAINDKLTTAWSEKAQGEDVFAVRAQAENLYNVLTETINNIAVLTAKSSFATVDTEIITEGIAIINILNGAKVSLDKHADFLNWRQS